MQIYVGLCKWKSWGLLVVFEKSMSRQAEPQPSISLTIGGSVFATLILASVLCPFHGSLTWFR